MFQQKSRKNCWNGKLYYLDNIRKVKFGAIRCNLIDIGDGIVVRMENKNNSIGGEVLEGINNLLKLQKKSQRIVCNQGVNFSVGANIYDIYDGN